MNTKTKQLTFKELMEEHFGSNFSIGIIEMGEFIQDLVKQGMDEDEISRSIVELYRDDGIDFNSLKDLFKYMGYYLPSEFAFFADKAKILLRETCKKVATEDDLFSMLYFYYQNDRIDYNVFKTCILLMNRQLTKEFESMNEIERKTRIWVKDKNGDSILLSNSASNLVKCITELKEFDLNDIFIPSSEYERPFQFVTDYLEQNNISEDILVNKGLDRKRKYSLSQKDVIKKEDVFKLIFMLDLPISIAKQFMTICGYTFSPLSKVDLFFLDYLNGKYPKVKTLRELTELSRKYCYTNFEFTQWV